MKKDKVLSTAEFVERSISKRFRRKIWGPFIKAVREYELIQENDRIAICISGGKDSMLLAKLMQMLQRYSEVPFECEYIAMDPGFSEESRQSLSDNCALLGIPVRIFSVRIFDYLDTLDTSPCYLCAKMRRGHLYHEAASLGCNKIALGHHYNDVIETTLLGMFYSSQLQGMMPKLHADNYENMELIRPLYCIKEDSILAWQNYNQLQFSKCVCRFSEQLHRNENGIYTSKREEVKQIIRELKKINPDIEMNIFNSLHRVNIDTFPGLKYDDTFHSFLENYSGDEKQPVIRKKETSD